MERRQSLLGKHGYAFSTLTDAERASYKKIYEAIMRRERIILGDLPITDRATVSRLLACVDMDHPELFWMDGYQNKRAAIDNAFELMQDESAFEEIWDAMTAGADYDGDGEVSFFERRLAAGRAALEANPLMAWSIKNSLTLSPFWTARRIKLTQERLNEYVQGCKALITEDMDDYQVFRRVFEYVASHTSYNLRKSRKSQDIRSVFIERESVCKGYAEALQYLLLMFGIPCFTAQGIATSISGTKSAHAWNYVLVDGVWNIVDITAGDRDLDCHPERLPFIPAKIRPSFVDYRYMSLSGAGYSPSDFIEYPSTGATADYFEREGYVLAPGSWLAFVKICSKLHDGTEDYVQVKCAGSFDWLDAWMRSSFTFAVRLCVACDEDICALDQLDEALVEKAKALSNEDVSRAGWGEFKLHLCHISPKKDVFLLMAAQSVD